MLFDGREWGTENSTPDPDYGVRSSLVDLI